MTQWEGHLRCVATGGGREGGSPLSRRGGVQWRASRGTGHFSVVVGRQQLSARLEAVAVEADPTQDGLQTGRPAILGLKPVVAHPQVHDHPGRLAGRVVVAQLGPVVAERAFAVEREGAQLHRQPVVGARLVEVVEAGGGELGHVKRGPALVQQPL